MEFTFRPLDIVVIVLYFVGIAFAGVYFATRNKNTEDYFLGGRNFPGWAIGLSMVGTSISSITFLAYPGDAYRTAWLRLIGAFTLPIAVLIASIWFLPFFRRGQITSAYEYLEGRFGPKTRVYAASVFLVGQLLRIGTILFLLALLFEQLFGWPIWLSILVAGVFVSFYTVLGGIEAVVWTDVAQTIVLVLGGFLILGYITLHMPEGLMQVVREAWAEGKFRFAETEIDKTFAANLSEVPRNPDGALNLAGFLTFKETSWGFSLWKKTATMMLLLGFSCWISEYCSNQNVIQRYCASRSPREARKAMWICALSSVPIWTYFMFLGTAMYIFFRFHPDQGAFEILTGAQNKAAESILPYFVLNYLPAGIAGLVIAAVLAAAMSSLDSSINAIATISIVDIYRRHWVKDASEQHYFFAARLVAVAASVLMLAIAYWYSTLEVKTYQDTGIILAAFCGGGLLGIYMLGFLTPWGDDRSIGCGIIATIGYTLWRAFRRVDWIEERWALAALIAAFVIYLALVLTTWKDRPATSILTILAASAGLVMALYGGIRVFGAATFVETDEYYTGNIANAIMAAAIFIFGFLLPRKKRDLANLTVWTQDDTPLN